MGTSRGWVFLGVVFIAVLSVFGKFVPEKDLEDYSESRPGIRYDEYPLIVPKKRTALLLDRIMVAIQKAIEEEEAANAIYQGNSGSNPISSEDAVRTMDLQRRGHQSGPRQQKGRVYWRCYFNAVSCF